MKKNSHSVRNFGAITIFLCFLLIFAFSIVSGGLFGAGSLLISDSSSSPSSSSTSVSSSQMDDSDLSTGMDIAGGEDQPDDSIQFLSYSTSYCGSLYFRSQSYGDYDYHNWYSARPFDISSAPINPLFLTSDKIKSSVTPDTIKIKVLKATSTYYLPSYTFTSSTIPAENDYEDELHTPMAENSTYQFSFDNIDYLTSEVLFSSGYFSSTAIAEYEESYQQYVTSTYLQIPNSTKETLLEICQENNIFSSDYNVISEVKNYLQSACTYSLDSPDYPTGSDGVVYFLTKVKKGCCRYFASAATLLYRALGIPARVVSGLYSYSNGSSDQLITGRGAHAWTEIYKDGIGWIRIDTTPGSGMSNGDSSSPLIVSSVSSQITYDGQSHSSDKCEVKNPSVLQTGDSVVFTASKEEETEVGRYELLFTYQILDSSGYDVTASYEVTTEYGYLTIEARPIEIATASATKQYDGKPLEDSDYSVDDNLVSGDKVTLKVTGSQTEVGQSDNTIDASSLSILDASSNDVTRDYAVTYSYGTLTVLPPSGSSSQ